jgi:hypothetical protein
MKIRKQTISKVNDDFKEEINCSEFQRGHYYAYKAKNVVNITVPSTKCLKVTKRIIRILLTNLGD